MVTQRGGIRVLLVDDHRILREGLRSCLESISTIEVVGEACNGEEAMRCIKELQPQVVVMDIKMPKMDGVTATRLMTGQYPDVAVVGLSVTEDQYHKTAMERAGAFGVITKGKQGLDELCGAIEKAAATMLFISSVRKKGQLLN
jgi:two-component system, NarL family, invasion response regulator UvrY